MKILPPTQIKKFIRALAVDYTSAYSVSIRAFDPFSKTLTRPFHKPSSIDRHENMIDRWIGPLLLDEIENIRQLEDFLSLQTGCLCMSGSMRAWRVMYSTGLLVLALPPLCWRDESFSLMIPRSRGFGWSAP